MVNTITCWTFYLSKPNVASTSAYIFDLVYMPNKKSCDFFSSRLPFPSYLVGSDKGATWRINTPDCTGATMTLAGQQFADCTDWLRPATIFLPVYGEGDTTVGQPDGNNTGNPPWSFAARPPCLHYAGAERIAW